MILFFAAALIGLVFIYSATRSMDGNLKYIIVQCAGFAIGLVLMFVITYIDYDDLASLWKLFVGISLFLLVLVLIIGIGAESTGTKGWIRFGSIGIQPAEIVKICFIITLAKHLDTIKNDINYIKNVFLLLMHLAVPLILILAQPDFGSAMVFVFIFIVMVFVANIDWRYILTGCLTGGVIAVVSWFFFFDSYQKNRSQCTASHAEVSKASRMASQRTCSFAFSAGCSIISLLTASSYITYCISRARSSWALVLP